MDRKFDVAKWRNDQYNKEIDQTDKISQLRSLIREEITHILTSLKEDTPLQKAQKYPKEIIKNFDFVRLPKRKAGPGSGVDVFSKEEFEQIFDLIPDTLMYTMSSFSVDAQQAIPTFLFSKGGWWKDEELNYGDKGNMDKSIDYQIKRDIELGKEPRLD